MELKLDIKSDFSKLIKKHFCQIYFYKIQHDLIPTRQNFISPAYFGPSILLSVPSCQYRSVIKQNGIVIFGCKICSKNKLNHQRPNVCQEIDKTRSFQHPLLSCYLFQRNLNFSCLSYLNNFTERQFEEFCQTNS